MPEDIALPSAKDLPAEEKEEESSVEKETLAENIEGFEKLSKDQQAALLKYVRDHVQGEVQIRILFQNAFYCSRKFCDSRRSKNRF